MVIFKGDSSLDNFHQLGPLGQVGQVVAMSVCLSVCLCVCGFAPLCAVFFQVSHWPSGHMISSRSVIGPGVSTFQQLQHFLAVLALFSGCISFQRVQHFLAVWHFLAFFFFGFSTFWRFQHFLSDLNFFFAVLALSSGFITFFFSNFITFQWLQHFLAVLAFSSTFSTFKRFQHFLAVLALSPTIRVGQEIHCLPYEGSHVFYSLLNILN